MSFITNKFELLSKLDGLREQAKKKYIDVGGKLLIFSANTMNNFAKHLIVLQGKDPNAVPQEKIAWKDPSVVAAVNRVVSNIRPSFNFGGSSRGWSQGHFKNPEKYHPILVSRIKMDEKGVLNVTKEPGDASVPLKVVDPALGDVLNMLAGLQEAEASLGQTLSKEENLEAVEVVSGARQVSEKKVTAKKVKSKTDKKVVKVKRVKKGVFRRVED
jgi:hypothetical protein